MYAKVYKSLWEGSMVGRPEAQLVFVFLLAHANSDGLVDTHPRLISMLTGLDEGGVKKALGELESADFTSRSPEDQGARIVRVDEHRDWGWRIVNYCHYRTVKDKEMLRQQAASRKREQRERMEAQMSHDVTPCHAESRSVTLGHASSRQGEGEGEGENLNLLSIEDGRERENGSTSRPKRQKTVRSPRDVEWAESFPLFWEEYPRRQKRPEAERAWMKLPLRGKDGFDQVLLGLYRWQSSEQWKDPQYVPLPATWLNAHQYEDDIPEVNHAS